MKAPVATSNAELKRTPEKTKIAKRATSDAGT
jgi:hypothetical protein